MRQVSGFRKVTALYLALVMFLLAPLVHFSQAQAEDREIKTVALKGALGAGALAVLFTLYKSIGKKAVATAVTGAPAASVTTAGAVGGAFGWLNLLAGKLLRSVGYVLTRPYILGPALLVGGGLLAVHLYNQYVTQGRHDPMVVEDSPIGGPDGIPNGGSMGYPYPGAYGLPYGNGAATYTMPGAVPGIKTPNFVDMQTGRFNTLGIPGAGNMAVTGADAAMRAQRASLHPRAPESKLDVRDAQADRAQAYGRLMSAMKTGGAGVETAIDAYRNADTHYKELTGSH